MLEDEFGDLVEGLSVATASGQFQQGGECLHEVHVDIQRLVDKPVRANGFKLEVIVEVLKETAMEQVGGACAEQIE